MTSKLLAFFLMTSLALGQAVCVTNQNNVGMPLGPLQHPAIGLERGTELRHNNYAFDGGGPIDLSQSFVRYEIVSGPTMSISRTNVTYSATILGPGLTQVIITPSIPAGAYYTKFLQYQANNSNYVRTLSWDTLVVTNPASATGGGSVNVSVTTTANVLVASSGTGNVVTGITANGSTVTEHRGTVAGGGGDAPVINGERPTNLTFNASFPFTVATVTNAQGMTITYGLSGNAGTIVIPAGNTSTSEFTFVSTNAQYYTAGATATQLFLFAITPAAGMSPGSRTQGFIPCTGSQVFAVFASQGGLGVTNGTAPGGWGYVPGGSATSTNGLAAVSGAGSVAILSGTSIVFHAGAPGGSAYASSRSPGGGDVGGYSGTTSSGGPGTQTNHGAAATATAGATAGSSTNGGNGTALGGTVPGNGGGGGRNSGGGSCGVAYGNIGNGGGGGSTDLGQLLYGITDRSAVDTASPPGTSAPQYKSPYGVAGSVVTNGQRGNSSFISIVSFPST